MQHRRAGGRRALARRTARRTGDRGPVRGERRRGPGGGGGGSAGAVGGVDRARAEAAVRELLIAVGEDPDRPGLKDTPARVARAYTEIFAGLWQDPGEILATTFEEDHDELVLVKDIPMYSTCEHHLVPFHGIAHVAYI